MPVDLLPKLAEGGVLAVIIAVLLGLIFFLIKVILDLSEKRYKDASDKTERMIGVLTKFQETADLILKAASK